MLRALYVDFNSYFASVEQQLRPELRNRPIGVLPVMADTTCCIAASYEAKAHGVTTGTRVRDARALCPDIILVEARPALYVEYHHKLVAIVESCLHVERTLSIDEMVCRLTGSHQRRETALELAAQIKRRISDEAGRHIRCSIGIAPNTFLAKVASNLQKPDGCIVIEQHELPERLLGLELRDLNGIGRQIEQRLNKHGILSIADLYAASPEQLGIAWGSIEGERMFAKLRGAEFPEREHQRKSLGHSHVLSPELRTHHAAYATLHRLLQKAAARLRSYQLCAGSVQLKVKFLERKSWKAEGRIAPSSNTINLLQAMDCLWQRYPATKSTPYAVGISFGNLTVPMALSGNLFEQDSQGQQRLGLTLDWLNQRYGKNTVYFGGAHMALSSAPMRIAFTHIPDLVVESDK